MFKCFLAALLLTATSTGVSAYAPCASGMIEISVEGVNGVFCVSGSTICAAGISQGACPAVQEGLAYGSYCGVVASGVYGCKVLDSESVKTFQPWVEPGSTPAPTTVAPTPAPTIAAPTPAPTTAAPTPAPATTTPAPATVSNAQPTNNCANGGSPVSVEGVQGSFCVTGSNICAANVSNGMCPAAQSGLPFGSYCGKVASGVYGCKVLTDSASGTPAPTPVPTTSKPSLTPSVSPATTPAPTSSNASGNSIGSTSSVTTTTTTIITNPDCPNGGSLMSIEGVEKIFCVSGIACAAEIATGNCPGKQDGLQFGSFCDVVRTGVYGCRPFVGENQKPAFKLPAPLSCVGNAAGSTPVSIVGAMRDFCAQEPICSGDHDGNCPGVQLGLDQPSTCAILSNGVHGCIFK